MIQNVAQIKIVTQNDNCSTKENCSTKDMTREDKIPYQQQRKNNKTQVYEYFKVR